MHQKYTIAFSSNINLVFIIALKIAGKIRDLIY